MEGFRKWLEEEIERVEGLRGENELQRQVSKQCSRLVVEAVDRAADLGMFDIYQRFKDVEADTPRDARAVLASVLASLPEDPVSRSSLTVKQVANRLGVGVNKVYALCRSGQLPNYRLGKAIRVRLEDLEAFEKELVEEGQSQRGFRCLKI